MHKKNKTIIFKSTTKEDKIQQLKDLVKFKKGNRKRIRLQIK